MNNNNYINFSYKGFSWPTFYKILKRKFELVKQKCNNERANDLLELANNNLKYLEVDLSCLNYESREALLRIVKRFNSQFKILYESCTCIEGIENIIIFLEDLPYRLREIIEELKNKQESRIESFDYNIINLCEGKIIQSYPNYEEGQIMVYGENVGKCQHFFC